MRAGRLIALFVCAFFIYGAEPEKEDTPLSLLKAQLLQTGITEQTGVQLRNLGLHDLREVTVSYLSEEQAVERFSGYLAYFEKWEYGRQLLAQLYPRLFIAVEPPVLRLSLCRSVIRTVPERGAAFLLAELETVPQKNRSDLIQLFSGYSDDRALKTVLKFLEDSDSWIAAAASLGTMGRKEAIPHLIRLLRRMGKRDLRKAAALSLKQLTGYDFGTNYDVWQIWWDKYGELFEVKRLFRDFRIIHSVEDYAPIHKDYFDYFHTSLLKTGKEGMEGGLEALQYLGRIIQNPKKWRGVLFRVRGKVTDIEFIPEEKCYIAAVMLDSYPFCQIICPGNPPAGEQAEFRAVFYKLRGDQGKSKPVLVFTGYPEDEQKESVKDPLEVSIQSFASPEPAVQKAARKRVLAMGKKAVSALTRAVEEETDPIIRAEALLILSEISPEESLSLLEKYLVSKEPLLQSCAQMAMERILKENSSNSKKQTLNLK